MNVNSPHEDQVRLLQSFVNFMVAHPELRFWQALSVWSDLDIFARKPDWDGCYDTFYWKEKNR